MKYAIKLLLLSFCSITSVKGQERITVEDAIVTALKNNRQFQVNEAEIRTAGYHTRAAGEIPKTGFFAENEDLRPSDKTGILKIGISQSVAWPGLYAARKQYFKELEKYARINSEVLSAAVRKDVRTAYYQLWYLQEKGELLQQLSDIYSDLSNAAGLRVKTGDAAALDRIAADAKMKELQAFIGQTTKEMAIQQQQLMMLLNRNEWLLPLAGPLKKIEAEPGEDAAMHPSLSLQQQNVQVASSNVAVQRNTNRPELSGRIFTQRVWGANDPFTGFSVTASVPLLGAGAYKNKVRAAAAEMEVQEELLAYKRQLLETQAAASLADAQKNAGLLGFYEGSGLQQASEIIEAARLSYKAGEISFAELSQFLGQGIGVRQNYLEALNRYNQSVIQLMYFNNR